MKSLGRLFVVTGICLLIASTLFAAELPAGAGANWTIESYVYNATKPVDFRLSNCTIGTVPYHVVPGGVVRAAADLCGSGLGVVPAPADAASGSQMIFDDGATHASYFVPALDRGVSFGPVAPIRVDAQFGTYLTVYNDNAQTLTWTVYGPDGSEAGRGDFAASKGWSQTAIAVPVRSGSLKVVAGCPAFGICPAYPFLGFVAVTDVRGGNAIVTPLK
jgi:hypothetical protein